MAVVLKAISAVRHLRRVRHVKAGPVETRRRGTSTAHITHQHTSWANSEDSRARAGQTKQPQERAPPPSSQGRAEAVTPALRAAVLGTAKWSPSLVLAIFNLELHIYIKIRL